jgi:hypothetical protein
MCETLTLTLIRRYLRAGEIAYIGVSLRCYTHSLCRIDEFRIDFLSFRLMAVCSWKPATSISDDV